MKSADEALKLLKAGNKAYLEGMSGKTVSVKESGRERESLAKNGQKPYAVIVSCSDSRVPPEIVFNAGLGELFVIRSAGGVVGDFELGSIEYGAEHLGAKLIVVMGHTHCGAVAAALEGGEAKSAIAKLVAEVKSAIGGEKDAHKAENLNIFHSKEKILASPIVKHLGETAGVKIVCAKYDILTGVVAFLS